MKRTTLSKVILALASVVSIAVLSGCASTNAPYRNYYLDSSCRYYYVDIWGNKVYEGMYGDTSFVGLPLMQAPDGRWYYQDSYGNRIYTSRHCHYHR